MVAFVAMALFSSACQADLDRRVLLPLDFKDVRLTGGMLKRQLDETKAYYLRISNDDLLLGFRKRAGKPAPGKELGGWYTADTFHVFGQIVSGLARLYAATGDSACKKKAEALYDGWKACLADDGYFYASTKPNAPHYTYDKMVGGLVDLALYCGRRDAFESLAKITGWAEKNLDRSNVYAFNAGGGPTEWYTLSENLYRAYLASRDERYRAFAKVWEFTDYWNLYAADKSIFDTRPDGGKTEAYHAYSHVNNLGGAAMAYRVTGDKHYLDTIVNAYDFLQENECFATGGFGPNEGLVPKERLGPLLANTTNTFETQCGTWAVFKLCKHLESLTGDARFGDWTERVAYNGIGASIPMSSSGQVFYYSDYNPNGGEKRNIGDGWTCCTGTRPMAVADVCDQIYFRSDDRLMVNLFVPSTATMNIGGTKVTVVQDTKFPEAESTKFTLRLDQPAKFSFGIRKPGWLDNWTAALNGKPVDLVEDSKHCLSLDRKWKSGDTVELQLPLALRSVPLYADKPYPSAIAVGPVILAFRSETGNPATKINLENLNGSLEKDDHDPLTYRLRTDHEITARPFYKYGPEQEYFLYLDKSAGNRIAWRHFKKSSDWNDFGPIAASNVVGAWCEGTFVGNGVRLLGYRFDDAGKAEVKIDGKVVGTLDQYGPGRALSFDWRQTNLGPGKHTIRLTVVSDKNPASKGSFINVAGLELIP